MEGIGLVVRIVDEAVSPIVPLWQRDPQPGVHVLQKLAAVLDGLQGQCPRQQGGFAVCRQRPLTRRGSTCLSVAPLGARQNGSVSGPRASPCPHGVTGVPPWRGSDHHLPLLYPSLFGVQTPQRGTASRDALLHTVPRQPFLTRRCQRQPNMPLDPAQRPWVSPPVGEDPPAREPCSSLYPLWPPAGAPDPRHQDPEYQPRGTQGGGSRWVSRCGLWYADR